MLDLRTLGFDITDESFYLLWITDPARYPVSLSQFGFVYHPLFRLLDGDIAALRATNVTITWICGVLLAREIVPHLSCEFGRWGKEALAIALGSVALLVFDNGLMTPSYNNLALQGLLVAAAGMVRLAGPEERGDGASASWLAIGMIAAGGTGLFLGKPSSAALLAPVAAAYLLFVGEHACSRERLRQVAMAGVASAALLLAAAIMVDGGAIAFATRLAEAMEIAATMGGGHDFAAVLRFDIPHLDRAAMLMIGTTCTVTALLRWASTSAGLRDLILPGLAVMALLLVALELAGAPAGVLRINQFQRLVMLAIPATALVSLMLSSERWLLSRWRWATATLLGVLPFIYAFGSNAHYWQMGGAAALFWVLGALLLMPERWAVLFITPIAQMLCALLLGLGVAHPYRQPGPATAFAADIRAGRSILRVDAGFARQVAEILGQTRAAGYHASTPIVDLTGQSPGLVYLLQGVAPGQPWLLGGYPGSHRAAKAALALADCSALAEAWLIVEPGGQRALGDDVAIAFGADRKHDYAVAATWHTTPGYRDGAPVRRQWLLRPTRSAAAAQAACTVARRSST